jgi:hypothetical protein
VHHRIASAVKRVEFVSNRVSYVFLRGRWCNIVVLNEHAPSEEKNDDSKDSFDVDRFNLRKVSELEVRKQYRIKISNRFAALEYLNDSEGIIRAWENSPKNIKTSAKEGLCLYELRQHKPWFDEESSRLFDQRKQAKMQWLQNPNQSTVGNPNN